MKIELDIPDDKWEEVKALLDKLPYVKYEDVVDGVSEGSVAYQTEIPQWQIEETRRRLHALKNGETTSRPWSEASKDIFNK